MTVSIGEIKALLGAKALEYEYFGNENLNIAGFSRIEKVARNSVIWIKHMDEQVLSGISNDLNLLIVTEGLLSRHDTSGYNIISSEHSKAVFFEILNSFFPPSSNGGIAKSAIVETEDIGSNTAIGHNTFICQEVKIGNNVTIKHNVSIQCPAVIGDNCIIESGVVIGSFGYGYYRAGNEIRKVPDYGGVIIGNGVEIGANTCIDRGTLGDTIIEDYCKIDNLCHIAHNVHIGPSSYVVALSLLGGSAKIGESAYIAPGAIVMNQKSIGKNAFVGMGRVPITS